MIPFSGPLMLSLPSTLSTKITAEVNGMRAPSKLTDNNETYLWHPCSQPQDINVYDKGIVKQALGNKIFLNDGNNLIDAISSWWCKTLGHNHPRLKQALYEQAEKFEHVMLACLTNTTVTNLSQSLAQITNYQFTKAFYASDGASAIEIALKMCFHLRYIEGNIQKKKILTLKNSYHGETMLTLGASDCDLYKKPYAHLLNDNYITLDDIPYLESGTDPDFGCDIQWERSKIILETHKDTICTLLVEPIVQGAGGIKIYSIRYLEKLCNWCSNNDIYVIFDEIMTGIGRTGKMFAYQHLHNVTPDFICLGKGLSAGWLPLSCVLAKDGIYDSFYKCEGADAFLHSHTYSGNALGCAVALETIKIINEENILNNVSMIANNLHEHMLDINEHSNKLENIRSFGAITAADIKSKYMHANSYIYKKSLEAGILLRPMGNTIYWTPPLNSTADDIIEIATRTFAMLKTL